MRTLSSNIESNKLKTKPSMASTQNAPCLILNLPAEVLSAIFSSLPNPLTTPKRWPKFNSLSPSKRLIIQPVLVVRQVCRRFRAVANDLLFWLDDNFELCSFVSNFQGPVRESSFLKAILNDQHLINSLGKRKNWRFSRFSSLCIVFKAVPLFRENVTGIALVDGNRGQRFKISGYSFKRLISILELCPHLQSLCLQRLGNLDVDQISQVVPALNVLRISDGRLNSHVDASLDTLSNLRELSLNNVNGTLRPALPTLSAPTLKVLEICLQGNRFSFESLPLFSNLSTLSISPCNQQTCEVIIASNSTLKRFDVGITHSDPVPFNTIIAMISAPSLKTVEAFSFNLLDDPQSFQSWTEDDYKKFLQAISSNIPLLHTIHLCMPFRKTCFQYLAQMINLKSVSWKGKLIDLENRDEEQYYKEIAEVAVECAFVGFQQKPKCRIIALPSRIFHCRVIEMSAREMQELMRRRLLNRELN